MKQLIENPNQEDIRGILREPIFISESAMIKHVLKQFQKKRVQMAVVTNEVGELAGIVSMEDILEELVGEIQDEYDNEDPIVVRVDRGIYLVNAHNTISDINRLLPYKFDESEHYYTLAGLISEVCYDRELKEEDIIELNEYTGVVKMMYRNSVEKVLLTINDGNIIEDLPEESEE